jgi:hypothetical protein
LNSAGVDSYKSSFRGCSVTQRSVDVGRSGGAALIDDYLSYDCIVELLLVVVVAALLVSDGTANALQ